MTDLASRLDALLELACNHAPHAQARTELREDVREIRQACEFRDIGDRSAIAFLLGKLRRQGVDVSAYRSTP